MKFERIGNIVTITKGKKPTFSEKPNANSARVLRIDDLRNDNDIKFTDDKSGVLATKDDILLAWDGANAGTIGYGKEGYIGSTIAVLRKRNSEAYSTIFIGKFLQTQSKLLREKSTGATIPHIDRSLLENLKLPAIPITDQIRIAYVLSKAETLITKREESIRMLDEYIKSVFFEMFGDPVKNEKGWKVDSFNKSLFDIIAGSSSSNESKFSDPNDREVGILKVSAVTKGTFNPNEVKIVRWSQLGNTLVNPQEGDLLFSRANTRELVGATCIVDKNYPDLYIPDKIWVLQLHASLHNKYFILYTFQNLTFRKEFAKGATGSSGSMLNISMGKLRNVKVPYPPITLQNQFGRIVERAEALKKQYRQSLHELESLFRSISQQAFKGELDLGRMQSKAIDQEIERVSLGSKQTKPVETKTKKKNEEDNRYGDPFDIDETAAKKQGAWFYNEWLRIHSKTAEQKQKSVWLQSRKSGKALMPLKFTEVEGTAIIEEIFAKHNLGFSYQEFEAILKKEKITHTPKELRKFLFQKLEQKELVQYFASKEWMAAIRNPKFNPPGGSDFVENGSIWFLASKTGKAR